MWNFTDAFYREQGVENSGYATDDFLTEIAQVAGVEPGAALRAVNQNEYERELQAAEAEARAAGVSGTPTFVVEGRGRSPRTFQVRELTLEAFEQALGPELGP
jgi:predicted DsbA family dithiol-disulfide isomerase